MIPYYTALSVLWMYYVNEQFHGSMDWAYAADQETRLLVWNIE